MVDHKIKKYKNKYILLQKFFHFLYCIFYFYSNYFSVLHPDRLLLQLHFVVQKCIFAYILLCKNVFLHHILLAKMHFCTTKCSKMFSKFYIHSGVILFYSFSLGIEGLEPSRISMDQRIFTFVKSGLSLYPPINKFMQIFFNLWCCILLTKCTATIVRRTPATFGRSRKSCHVCKNANAFDTKMYFCNASHFAEHFAYILQAKCTQNVQQNTPIVPLAP